MTRAAWRKSTQGISRILGAAAACSLVFGIAAVAFAPACGAAPAPPIVVRDDLGHEITLEHPPQRLISLLPPLTETVCALGECGRLVATDRYSNWPDSVKALPKTGGLEDPLHRSDRETSPRSRPALELPSESPPGCGSSASNPSPSTRKPMRHISHVITVIGTILDVPERAAALNRRIDAEVREIGEQAIARAPGRGAVGVLRGRSWALCRRTRIVHRRDAHAIGRTQHRRCRTSARSPSSIRNTSCAAIPTSFSSRPRTRRI